MGRRLRWFDGLVGLALGLLVATVVWVGRTALIPIDPWDYVEGARNFPNGVWNDAGLSRWAMVAPIMVLASWWGNAEATYYVYPVLAAGLLAAALYWIGARLVGRATGLVGAVLTLAFPVVFVHLSRGYPDMISIAFLTCALLCLLLARDAGRGWRWAAWLVAAGAAVGWSFEVRELSVLAFPALGYSLWRVGRPVRSLAVFALAPLAILAADVYLDARYFGDPLLKVHWLSGNSIDNSIVAADAVYVGHDRWFYLSVAFRLLWARTGGPALTLIAAFGLVGGLVLWRRLAPLWIWGASVLALMLAAGGFLRPGAPFIRLDILRYSLSFLVPLAMTAACVMGVILVRCSGWRRVAAGAVAVVMAVSVVVPAGRFARTFTGYVANEGGALRELGTYLAGRQDLPGIQIWSDWGTQRLIPVYSTGTWGGAGWAAGDYRSLNRLLREPPLSARHLPQPGDLVVVYSRGQDTCYHCSQALADLEAAYGPLPLPGWQEVFRSSSGNLTAYQLPAGYTWPAHATVADSGSQGQQEATEAP